MVWQFTNETLHEVDEEMDQYLNGSYEKVKAIVHRNRAAFEALMERLLEGPTNSMSGDEVRAIVERLGHPQDLRVRSLETAPFL